MKDSRSFMVKPYIEERGLKLVAFEERHILPFAKNISAENLREFEVVYEMPVVEALESCLNRALVFAVEKNGEPLAVTGVDLEDDHALIWCMFSKDMRKNWISFARASEKLMKFYEELHPNLVADVWTQNDMIHQWLVYLNFTPEMLIELQNGQTVFRFVRCTSKKKSVHNKTLRPVLH
jgi:hypothetical protein